MPTKRAAMPGRSASAGGETQRPHFGERGNESDARRCYRLLLEHADDRLGELAAFLVAPAGDLLAELVEVGAVKPLLCPIP